MENDNRTLDAEMLTDQPKIKGKPQKYAPLEGQEAYQKGSGLLPELPRDELDSMEGQVQKKYMKFTIAIAVMILFSLYDIFRSYSYYSDKEESLFVFHFFFDAYVIGASFLMFRGKTRLSPFALNLGRLMLMVEIAASLMFYITTFLGYSLEIFAFAFVTAISWIILPTVLVVLSAALKAEIKRISEYKKLVAAFELKI
eukprot:CAMPEP_0114593596 /NCGR_PEP_ID=MMETSP0125-20121206/15184_1 /TAXON_ID=485358 ORGANISM="Aristerostoma sp., Strain ATCC 50986" /NCGR_SAMPLE_ID=MMETSP0125 /ASSEMBLY_ACC=CAM_ASM_000245 /LENGTH=198 /DNA_ID=CAMNT_0001792921 /DNA_START=1 /DNA_END=597 /DNA_ORIENTATION=+